MINMHHFLAPLFVAKRQDQQPAVIVRFAGSSFLLNEQGLVATCGHVVDDIREGEILGAKDLATGALCKVDILSRHRRYDFALLRVYGLSQPKALPLCSTPTLLGDDIQCLGFTSVREAEGDVELAARLLKGYVARIAKHSPVPEAQSLLECSFPSLAGFSGSPVVRVGNFKVVGMLYGNIESSVTVHSHTEQDDKGARYSEQTKRLLEYGVAHSTDDFRSFAKDLGIVI